MKTIKIMWFGILMLLSTALQAQVIEWYNHSYGGQTMYYVSKNYMANFDSIVYVPAQNWDIKPFAIDTFYTDANEQVHVVAKVGIGKNAHMAKAAFGNTVTPEQIANGEVSSIDLVAGTTQDVDFILPNPKEAQTITVVTRNNPHFDFGIFHRTLNVDYAFWKENKDWTSLGKATLTDDIVSALFGIQNISYKVEVQENKYTPGFYRLVNPYTSCFPYNSPSDYDASKKYYMNIHAEDPNAVWIEKTEMGMDWGYGMFHTWSLADYYISEKGHSPEEVATAGCYGTLIDGEITFPANALLVSMADYQEGGWMYANASGKFSILMPGYRKKDFSATVQYTEVIASTDGSAVAVGQLGLGADAKDVKAVVVTQNDDAYAAGEALANGTLEGTPVQAGRIEVPFDAEALNSYYLQLVVAVSYNGQLKTVVNAPFEYYKDGDPWKSIGIGTYTESILSTIYGGIEPVTYEVEIMEHAERPGLYRLMNVYATGVYPYTEENGGAPKGSFLEINACDPEGVYIPLQSLGIDWGDGEISYISEGARYLEHYDIETLKESHYMGAVRDGNILLPTFQQDFSDGSTIQYQGVVYIGNDGYYCGGQDGFCVTLPGATPKSPAKVRSNFVKQLEHNFIAKRFVPKVNKRMIKRTITPIVPLK